MACILCLLLAFLMIFMAGSYALLDEGLSLTYRQDAGIKVLNVSEELQRETLPLKMGHRFYKLHGLKKSSWYEVKISYPASIPASFSLHLVKNLEDLQMRNRRLLNTEKIIFKFDSEKLNSIENDVFVLVTVEPAGVVAKPNVQEQELVLFNIICEELLIGIPHRAWSVGIAALLCLVFAASILYYLPPELLMVIQCKQSDNASVMKDS
ncbi:hypothetical protein KSP39_PZI015382 [Platanthera zijinensis]|uniref:Uncharacterized protein n=1 Tax=Platanthera zijinensis TaxID=2320716 RepID=A0AAP0BAD8_9ASPA